MSDLARIMADSALIRPELPQWLWERYDRIFALAMGQVSAREITATQQRPTELDYRPLAPVVELRPYSRNAL